MTDRKRTRVAIGDILSAKGWPLAAFIGPRSVVGMDRAGNVGIGTVGGDIYGKPTLSAFVELSRDEAATLADFIDTERGK